MISETFNFIALIVEAIILVVIIIYVDIIMEDAAEIREIAQSCGWADMDKVRALDKKEVCAGSESRERRRIFHNA